MTLATALTERAHAYLEQPMRRAKLRARLLEPYRRRRFRSFGAGSVIHNPAWLGGAEHIVVGSGCLLLIPRLTAAPVDTGRGKPVIEIGDRVTMRPFAAVAASESVVIEDDVWIGSFSLISDGLGEPTNSSGAEYGAPQPVRVGAGTTISEQVAVLPGTTLGRRCFVEAGSVVSGGVPDGSVVTAGPVTVAGRAGPR